MSQPSIPYPGQQPMLSPAELQKFEAPLIALANLSGGDLRKLFYAFFSFLHRRTDFYCILPEDDGSGTSVGEGRNMGFKQGQAEQILLASFRQFPLRRVGPKPPVRDSKSGGSVVASAAAGSASVGGTDSGGTSKPTVTSTTNLSSSDEQSSAAPKAASEPESKNDAGNINGNDGTATNKITSKSGNEGSSASANEHPSTIRYTDDGKQIPVGNGGSTSRYVWTQTLEEVTVLLPVPEGTRAKDLDVKIGATSLSIRRKGTASSPSAASESSECMDFILTPLEGTLFAKIRPSESTWTLESTSSSHNMTTVLITLEKVQKTWWATVLTGDPIIDTSMVDSTRRIETYDEKTQAQIRRIMFDQHQERLGLPNSGELIGENMKVPPLPTGVEYIDNETLEKASISKK